jgi:hypothetical protein
MLSPSGLRPDHSHDGQFVLVASDGAADSEAHQAPLAEPFGPVRASLQPRCTLYLIMCHMA